LHALTARKTRLEPTLGRVKPFIDDPTIGPFRRYIAVAGRIGV